MSSSPLPVASTLTSLLPEAWTTQAFEDVIEIGSVRVARVGLAAVGSDGVEVTGAAAELGTPPNARASYELVERIATLEAEASDPARTPVSGDAPSSRPSRSNGVALHDSLEAACERARGELAERHLVLRAWYGDTVPQRLPVDLGDTPFAVVEGYDVRAFRFPDDGSSAVTENLRVVGVFALPRRPELPLAMGFAARPDEADALAAALREAVQCLAFLWGEELPREAPPIGPTAMHHLEYWQYGDRHAQLEAWLDGAHARWAGSLDRALPRSAPDAPIEFADLTPSWARDVFVVRARCASAIPLIFGVPSWAEALPSDLRVHPIA